MQVQQTNEYTKFFTVNNIFFALLRKGYNQSQVCDILSVSRIRLNNLISSSLSNNSRPSFSYIKRVANSIENISPSKCCKLFIFCNDHPEFKLNTEHLEYIFFIDKKIRNLIKELCLNSLIILLI